MPKYYWKNNSPLPQTKKHKVSFTNREKGEIFIPFLAFTNAKHTSVLHESCTERGSTFRVLEKPITMGKAPLKKPYSIVGTKKREKKRRIAEDLIC
jgi:hypothetical protein